MTSDHNLKPNVAEPLPIGGADLLAELRRRSVIEKQRKELHVDYYRIGHILSFNLPVSHRLFDLPHGIPGYNNYPWYTWLMWTLEERWRNLNNAWHHLGDEKAGSILQTELAALENWDSYVEHFGGVHLVTAHIATSLCLALGSRSTWCNSAHSQVINVARRLLEKNIKPWHESLCAGRSEFTEDSLHNINLIILFSAARLAHRIQHASSRELNSSARAAFTSWCRRRLGSTPHTEGSSYDGYLMAAVTEWLPEQPDGKTLLLAEQEALTTLIRQWIGLSLPGCPEVQAPLGDVEPEMRFWITSLARISLWLDNRPGLSFLKSLPPESLPAAVLDFVIEHLPAFDIEHASPMAGAEVFANALALKSGHTPQDLVAFAGLSQGDMGHLHHDGGSIVLAWQKSFWIIDPGYQDYRPGPARDFKVGAQSHNAPLIDGQPQTKRLAKHLFAETWQTGVQHASIDLSSCYEGLPFSAAIERSLWMIPRQSEDKAYQSLLVCDSFSGLPATSDIENHWHINSALGLAFIDGWIRLSNQESVIWIGSSLGAIEAKQVHRHVGSTTALTLSFSRAVPKNEMAFRQYWFFVCDVESGWSPPHQYTKHLMQNLNVDDAHFPSSGQVPLFSIELRLNENHLSAKIEFNYKNKDFEYAFYLMKDNNKLAVRWYSSDTSADFFLPSPGGQFYVLAFVRHITSKKIRRVKSSVIAKDL